MKTKTGEIIMKRKNQNVIKTIQLPVVSQFQISPADDLGRDSITVNRIEPQMHRKKSSYISHVNEYQLFLSSTKVPPYTQNIQTLQELQVQNFRLIEQNMKLMEWANVFTQNLRQKVMRIVHTIQQFRYLQASNGLFQVLAQINYHQQNGYMLLKKLQSQIEITNNNPESKTNIEINKKLAIFSRVHQETIQVYKRAQSSMPIQNQSHIQQLQHIQQLDSLDQDVIKAQKEQEFYQLLLVQSTTIQSLLRKSSN